LALRVLGEDDRGSELVDRLLASFDPVDDPGEPRAEVEVTFEPVLLQDRGLEPYADLRFAYASEQGAYVFENGSVRIRLTSDGCGTSMLAERDVRESLGVNYRLSMLRVAAAVGLHRADSLLVHGCAMVSPEGLAVLFVGASDSGKTTMVRRLPGWTSLADDAVVLEACPDEAAVWVSGTLFAGHERLPRRGQRHRLRHLMVLRPHATELSAPALTEAEAFSALSRHIFCPLIDGPIPAQVMNIVERVALRVPASALESSLQHDPTEIVAELASAGRC